MPAFDPIITLVANFSIGLLFLFACFAKATNFAVFQVTLAEYKLVPEPLISLSAMIVVGMELLIGIGAFSAASAAWAMLAAALLLFCYGSAIGLNLIRGRRDIDCGCTGPATRQLLSGWLLARNTGLAILALLGAAPSSVRELHLQDWFLIGLALLAAMSLYAAINQLMANAPRLDALDSIMEAG